MAKLFKPEVKSFESILEIGSGCKPGVLAHHLLGDQSGCAVEPEHASNLADSRKHAIDREIGLDGKGKCSRVELLKIKEGFCLVEFGVESLKTFANFQDRSEVRPLEFSKSGD
jgi:hypothetical protein